MELAERLLKHEVEKFKKWALAYPISERSGEWECDYQDWNNLSTAALNIVRMSQSHEWTDEIVSDLLYVIARDNEIEDIADELSKDPSSLLFLAHRALSCDEADAKWQIAARLGNLSRHRNEAESLLLVFVEDRDEYVRRRTLMALAKLGSEKTEAFAERAWESGHEYQRIASLWALNEVSSPLLPAYLQKAIEDGRKYVVQNAKEIQEI